MKPAIRLVVCDLDGTLLSPEQEVTDSVAEALRTYRQLGGMVTIATGRPMMSAARIAEQLQLELPAIYCNGAVVAAPNKTWHSTEFAASPFLALWQGAIREGVELLLFDNEKVYAAGRSPVIDAYERKEGIGCVTISEQDMRTTRGLNKLLLIGSIAASTKLWEQMEPELRGQYAVLQSEDNFLEIVPRQVNKGAALLKLMEIIGVHANEVLAIGNQINDLELLQEAGTGVAVGNSHPLLMKHADYVCRDGYGDGVIEALRRFGCLPDVIQL